MNFLTLTHSSLIIHENDKMSKAPQRYDKKHLSWKSHEIFLKYLIERLQNPLNWKLKRTDIIIMNNDHDSERQWKYYIA